MRGKFWCLPALLFMLVLSSCGVQQSSHVLSPPLISDQIQLQQQKASPTPPLTIPMQVTIPTPTPRPVVHTQAPPPSPPSKIPNSGLGPAPYGPPPAMTAEEEQLTQQLFALINSNRASINLYPFVWNSTLAGGARLHSWNMYHCGFSHTCPNGEDQCTRIAGEGFTFTDCGENIGLAGPSSPPWANVYGVQESMWNEPPNGWHRIHLTSTTLHRIGVGVYVDPTGWVWFTEDMVS
jgi:uncharacterized protein YkwD